MYQFGISTHLFHEHRLSRDHLVHIAAHGFEVGRAVRHALTLRLPERTGDRRTRRVAVGHATDTALGPRADRRAHAERTMGRRVLERLVRREPPQGGGGRSRGGHRRGRADSVSVSRSAPRRADERADERRRQQADAARRSVEEIADAAARVNVRVAVEVIPNALSDAATLALAGRRTTRRARRRRVPRLRSRPPDGRSRRGDRDALRPPVDDARPRQRREARRSPAPYRARSTGTRR